MNTKMDIDISQRIRELDLYNRIYMGQYDRIFDFHGFRLCHLATYHDDAKDDISAALTVRRIVIPELGDWGFSASLGIWGPDIPEQATMSYDIQQSIRFQDDVKSQHWRQRRASFYISPPRIPFFHCTWKWDLIPWPDWSEHAHKVLQAQDVPGYRAGYMILRPWLCPILIESFSGDEPPYKGEVLIGDSEVIRLLDVSAQCYQLVQAGDMVALFELLYPNADTDKLRPATERLTDILKRGPQ